MEKLIKLLNEYHHLNSDLIYYWWDEEYERVYFYTELPEEQKKKLAKAGIDDEWIDEQRVDNEWICSKKFWFIKWLVENDKINWWRIENNQDYAEYFWSSLPIEEYGVEILLMLLAIADDPINYLCCIIRQF